MKYTLIFLGVVAVTLVAAVPYSEPIRDLHGAQVFRVTVDSNEAVESLIKLQKSTTLDFWTAPRLEGPVDIMALRGEISMLEVILHEMDLKYEVQIPDVGELIAQQEHQRRGTRTSKTGMDWTTYHEIDEINDWLDSLAASYPDIASVSDVGTSYEGRTMKMLKLSTGGEGKRAVFSDGGIHAREWIAPAVVTYFIDQFVKGNDEGLLDTVDFYFMPSINPDGYAYSFSDDRTWRKTRSPSAGSPCTGTDGNRNWDFHWMEGGASSNPCAPDYAGTEPFSEVEMKTVRDALLDTQPMVYLTFHSYSQLWMYPWGYTSDLPDNWEDLDAMAQDAVAALTAVHGTEYEIGSSTNVIYIAAGGSDDWALGVGGSEYAYTIELRDTGRYGFLLPEDLIIPTAEETFEAFKAVGRIVAASSKKQ